MSDLVIGDIGTVTAPDPSGLSVDEILERTQTELLNAGGMNLPAWDVQTGAITDTATTLTLEGRADDVPAGSLIEWDDNSMETALVKSTADTVLTLQTRGYLESTPAAHTAGTRVLVNSPFPKQMLFNSLKAVIGSLYGFGIYRKRFVTGATFTATAPLALPADARDVMAHVWVKHGLRWQKLRKGTEFEVLHETDPIEVQFWGYGSQGAALRLPYKADFTRPTGLTDNLATLGIPQSLQEALPLGVAGRILQGRDVPKAQADHIRRVMENQAVPLGAVTQISRQLWQGFLQEVQLERVRLMEANPPTITYGG